MNLAQLIEILYNVGVRIPNTQLLYI